MNITYNGKRYETGYGGVWHTGTPQRKVDKFNEQIDVGQLVGVFLSGRGSITVHAVLAPAKVFTGTYGRPDYAAVFLSGVAGPVHLREIYKMLPEHNW